ncbi:MAG: single-stranded DNA-binding protein [Acidobacteriaceae bacterium]
MNIFKNSVTLRGFLAKNAEVPTSDHIRQDSFAVLVLGIASGTWKKQTCEWIPRTEWYRIICPGPFLCGFTRSMKLGAYIEVTGELHRSDYDRSITVAGERFPVTQSTYEVHALTIRRLEIPAIGVDERTDGEDT